MQNQKYLILPWLDNHDHDLDPLIFMDAQTYPPHRTISSYKAYKKIPTPAKSETRMKRVKFSAFGFSYYSVFRFHFILKVFFQTSKYLFWRRILSSFFFQIFNIIKIIAKFMQDSAAVKWMYEIWRGSFWLQNSVNAEAKSLTNSRSNISLQSVSGKTTATWWLLSAT